MQTPRHFVERAVERAVGALSGNARGVGAPFDPATSIAPPRGLHSWVHYGVMAPGLPEPHRTAGVMAIVGTPGVALFANDHAITTSPRDTAYLVSATSSMRGGAFSTYSIAQDCAFASDGSALRFGDDLRLDGGVRRLRVRRTHPDVSFDLDVVTTDVVTHFVRLPGVYTHWSLLAQYTGTVGDDAVAGLCTVEYARGVGPHPLPLPWRPNLPTSFFTYQVLNLDDTTQLLLTEVLGPRGLVLARTAYVRSLDGTASAHTRDVRLAVGATDPYPTPAGSMRLPRDFAWDVGGLLHLDASCPGDWQYGLGAGFVGSFDYRGEFRGQPISGVGYVEYIDLR